VFVAGPDHKQVEARGGVTHNGGGPLPVTRPQKRGRKMQGSMHVSGTYSWKNQGAGGGVLVFKGGSSLPPARGVGSTLPPCELARSRPAERPSHRPNWHRPIA